MGSALRVHHLQGVELEYRLATGADQMEVLAKGDIVDLPRTTR